MIVVWALGATVAAAECITLSQRPSDRLREHKMVFVADVLGLDNIIEPESFRYRVRFQVIEAIKGIGRGEQAVQFAPTAEDFAFKVGQRVLVYVAGEPGRYSNQCTPTRETMLEDPEVQDLRRLARRR
jgi:hypothetical protein